VTLVPLHLHYSLRLRRSMSYTNKSCKVTYIGEIDVGFVHKEDRCHVTSKQANTYILTDARSLPLDGSEKHIVISISKEAHIFGATVLYVW